MSIPAQAMAAALLLIGAALQAAEPGLGRQAATVAWAIHAPMGAAPSDAPPEAAAIHADATTSPARLKAAFAGTEVWVRRLEGGAFAVAAFNKGGRAAQVDVVWKELGFGGQPRVRDVLNGRDMGKVHGGFAVKLPAGGAALYRVTPTGKAQ